MKTGTPAPVFCFPDMSTRLAEALVMHCTRLGSRAPLARSTQSRRVSATSAAAQNLRVTGMRCEGCAELVKDALLRAGAEGVKVDVSTGIATAAVWRGGAVQKLCDAVQDAGFKAEAVVS